MEIKIHTEFIRLDALLKFAGIASTGGEAKYLIQDGQVFLDGQPCIQRGKKIYPGMTVSVNENKISVALSGEPSDGEDAFINGVNGYI